MAVSDSNMWFAGQGQIIQGGYINTVDANVQRLEAQQYMERNKTITMLAAILALQYELSDAQTVTLSNMLFNSMAYSDMSILQMRDIIVAAIYEVMKTNA